MFAAARGWRGLLRGAGALAAASASLAPVVFSDPAPPPPPPPSSAASRGDQALLHPRALVHDLVVGDGKLLAEAFGIDPARARKKLANMVLIAGTSVPALAEEIAYEMDTKTAGIALTRFADGETGVQVLEHVRGKDVYVIQSSSQPVNENLMELLLTVTTLRRASAGTITAVIPYYGYLRDVGTVSTLTHQLRAEVMERLDSEVMSSARQQQGIADAAAAAIRGDRSASGAASSSSDPQLWLQPGLDPVALAAEPAPPLPQEDWGRVSAYPVSAADIAKMLEAAGVDRVISVDLQPPGSSQIEGFFGVPVENLRATPICVDHLAKLRLQKPVVVAPNEACIQLAHDIASGLQNRLGGAPVGLALTVEAGPSRGTDRYVHRGPPVVPPPQLDGGRAPEPRIELVGDVRGCDVVIVDEMIDTAGTLMRRVQLLKERGARRVVSFATHGLFNGAALQRITRSPLSDVIVTNTVPLRDDVDMRHTHKIVQLSVAPVLAEAILRVQMELSLQALRTPAYASSNQLPRYKGQE